ncbi:MAG: 1,4-dihydroxy-2-naphthoate octaprenyltransferase [Bacteroidaceae bacterium]|nr:1,4-dihydroxy-2-naphthoate octaprenyltransferase [Bacteroidaceae bacterium]
MNHVKEGSVKAWILASRPITLFGAAVPVMVALSKVWTEGNSLIWIPSVLCLLFALVMQIDANFVNDYFDCIKGVDNEDRLGPKRACAQGWISLPAMKRAIIATTVLACLIGLPLVYWGGLGMIAIGIACVVFCILYTTLLSRLGMGDVLVLLFFGIVPVCTTYYIQTKTLDAETLCLSLACGLVTDCLLIVNNYRDRETDARVNKRTLVTFIGARATEWLYLALGIAACLLMAVPLRHNAAWLVLWLVPHFTVWKRMKAINHGKELNKILGQTALNIMLFGAATCAVYLLS